MFLTTIETIETILGWPVANGSRKCFVLTTIETIGTIFVGLWPTAHAMDFLNTDISNLADISNLTNISNLTKISNLTDISNLTIEGCLDVAGV